MEIRNNALLRHLAEMPPAAVYAMADKVHLFNGFELCKKTPLSRVGWSDDGLTLQLEIAEDPAVEVKITLLNGELSAACNCGVWSPRGRCPHLVAALATVKKALSLSSFPMLQLPPAYLSRLGAELTRIPQTNGVESEPFVPQADKSYRLLVDRGGGILRLRLMHGGEQVAPHDPTVPLPLREFLRIIYAPITRGRSFEEFLARFGAGAPIVFVDGDREIPLHFDPAVRRSVLSCFDLEPASGEVSFTFTLDDGSPLTGDSFVADGYHFDLGRRRVVKVDDAVAGRFRAKLARRLEPPGTPAVVSREGGLRLAVAAFNDLQLSFGEGEFAEFVRRAVFRADGQLVQPRQVEGRYRLNIPGLADRVQLDAQWVVEGKAYPLSPETFWFFAAEGRNRLPQPLKAKKRVLSILSACFAALSARGRAERDKLLRVALNSPDFSRRGVRSEARAIVGAFWQAVSERQTVVQCLENEWLGVAVDVERQARLLELPAQLFGCDIFWEPELPGSMLIDRKPLMKAISRLRDLSRDAGFSLAVGGEELETVNWSFTLDATRSTIDWFELRPEISCDGRIVEESQFLEALEGGGIFRSNGALVMLDEESARALSLFAPGAKREVVRVPRLQILDWIALRRSGVRVLLSPEDERVIDSLIHFERIEKREHPAALNATLRNYQHEGFNWLSFLYEHRFGACLADDMGLGKTVQAITFMAGLKEGLIATEVPAGVPHLVVVPPTLIFNWESELARFYPDLKVGVYRGQHRRADFTGLDLVLTSYGMVQRDIEVLGNIAFHVVVFDEAQAVKNIHAETTGAVRRLKGRFKLTLTGTPVENHLGEYFSVMDLSLPGLLGPYEQFRKQMTREGADFVETLVRRTHPFILRRTKDMIAAELPPKVETDLYLEMSPRQKALYVRTVAQVKATVAEAYRLNAPGQARIIALTAILKLRLICLSSRLLLPEASDRSPKVELLVDQLQELFAEGHSVLVFSQFTSFLDIVQEGLEQHGLAYFRLDGSTPLGRRKELVHRFQNSEQPSVFLLSLKAGGKGLNLTRASYVFHLDPWWNPAVENQASDRAHRIGQQKQVTITRFLMRHSIEEKMMELKKRKLKLYRSLLHGAELEGSGSIGREDFEFLLGGG